MDKFNRILESFSSKLNDDLNTLAETADPDQCDTIDKQSIFVAWPAVNIYKHY